MNEGAATTPTAHIYVRDNCMTVGVSPVDDPRARELAVIARDAALARSGAGHVSDLARLDGAPDCWLFAVHDGPLEELAAAVTDALRPHCTVLRLSDEEVLDAAEQEIAAEGVLALLEGDRLYIDFGDAPDDPEELHRWREVLVRALHASGSKALMVLPARLGVVSGMALSVTRKGLARAVAMLKKLGFPAAGVVKAPAPQPKPPRRGGWSQRRRPAHRRR